MFDIIPNLLSSVVTILFPIFASYKALRTSDPAQLTPWLMYWVVISCFSLVEYWTFFIVSWVPFYAYLRLFLLSYLVLPQTQGARLIYQSYIHPFLAHHESDIDTLITNAHDRAKAVGLQYLKRAIDFVKQNVLGMQTQHAPPPSQGETYAQNLLSRFNLPSARRGLAAPAGDFYGLLSAAIGQVGVAGGSRAAEVEEMSRSGTLIPKDITDNAEKMTFLATQRERLRMLLTALDKEASDLSNEEVIQKDVEQRMGEMAGENLKKSRSEAEFDTIDDKDEIGSEKHGKTAAGGWMPWNWIQGAKGETKAKSTGVDTGS
ncbi:MAG: hypothetical protein L6R38_008059 [Xanthoria sp. 2 TBL-2021]|nr:MAG: hypothetical protein L6R38_008059 [Xanthoria sp. 2 TBL-2021]